MGVIPHPRLIAAGGVTSGFVTANPVNWLAIKASSRDNEPTQNRRKAMIDDPSTTPAEPLVQTSGYLVSLLPEGHDDRYLFTVQVDYRGGGLWSVKSRSRILGADGAWCTGFDWSEGPDEPAIEAEMSQFDREQAVWLADHRFNEATALRLAKDACRVLSYRGWTAVDALAGRQPGFLAVTS